MFVNRYVVDVITVILTHDMELILCVNFQDQTAITIGVMTTQEFGWTVVVEQSLVSIMVGISQVRKAILWFVNLTTTNAIIVRLISVDEMCFYCAKLATHLVSITGDMTEMVFGSPMVAEQSLL